MFKEIGILAISSYRRGAASKPFRYLKRLIARICPRCGCLRL